MIKLENVSKSYDDKTVLNGISLKIHDGGRIAICGESGSGKTTLLRLIAGLEKPDSGSITGVKKEELSFVFQEPRLFESFTVLENVLSVSSVKKGVAREKAFTVLDSLELSDAAGKYPCELSGGMMQRTSLARLLITDRQTVLLDEPFSSLDDAMAERICKVVDDYCRGKTLLLVSHNKTDAERLGCEIIYL